ncbi:MAG: hypothetical protein WC747_00960 [Candidatus Babeliales bacterium]|jgi:hypothetical protein
MKIRNFKGILFLTTYLFQCCDLQPSLQSDERVKAIELSAHITNAPLTNVLLTNVPLTIEARLNRAVQAGNVEEVVKVLNADSGQITVRALRTAILFAREESEYSEIQEYLPVGAHIAIVHILCDRLLNHLSEIESHMF